MPLATPDVRRHNLGLVLRQVLETGAIARSDIAGRTGLSRGAVTSLVADLLDAGLVREADVVPAEGLGRPRVHLEPAGDDVCTLTALLDADKATAVAAALDGTTLTRVERRHGRPMGDPDAVVRVLADVLDEVGATLTGRRIVDLSVVVWAPVGGAPPRVLADTDLEWGEVDLLALLRARSAVVAASEASGGELRLLPDSQVAALAEHASAGRPATLLYLKSDSGIGGAIVFDEGSPRVVGAALGHLPVVPGGALCLCGQHGCLVTVAGPDQLFAAAGLDAFAAEAGLAAASDEFVRRIRAGVPAATTAWRTGAVEIARTLQIVALSVDPDVIVVGGYLASLAGEVDAAFRAIQPHIAHAAELTPAPVIGSALGADAALLGAQHGARERLLADPLAI
jgi:predicted NBD/HSP70 family sugar kinase